MFFVFFWEKCGERRETGRGRKRKGRKAKKENKEHAIESAAGKKHKSSCFSQTRNHSLLFLRLSSAALFLKKKRNSTSFPLERQCPAPPRTPPSWLCYSSSSCSSPSRTVRGNGVGVRGASARENVFCVLKKTSRRLSKGAVFDNEEKKNERRASLSVSLSAPLSLILPLSSSRNAPLPLSSPERKKMTTTRSTRLPEAPHPPGQQR